MIGGHTQMNGGNISSWCMKHERPQAQATSTDWACFQERSFISTDVLQDMQFLTSMSKSSSALRERDGGVARAI